MKSFGDRMKRYEKTASYQHPFNVPIIIRVDGRAFHTFTQDLNKPFDSQFIEMMDTVGLALCNEIPGTRITYLQSDEISLLIYNEIGQEAWFDNKISKMVSVSASIASAAAMKWKYENDLKANTEVTFDSRVFTIPEFEIVNYFLWRQRDWERNSLNMLARKYYAHERLHNKKKAQLHELIHQAGDNWANLPNSLKRGRCIIKQNITKFVENPYYTGEVVRIKWVIDEDIPIFSKNREYILSKIPLIPISD